MFYETARNDHGLRGDPFKQIVAPRPIGWISSLGANGEVNLAPYSYFNAVSSSPPVIMFASEGHKHSVSNIEQTREFVCNLTTWDLREAVNATSAHVPYGVNEMELAGLTAAPSRLVKPPRVAESPCALECKLLQVAELKGLDGKSLGRFVTFGQVVGVHLDERFIKERVLDIAAMRTIARCGYNQYTMVDGVFTMERPA